MNIIRHDTSPFTSQLLFLMFRKAVMGVSEKDYSYSQRQAWCADVCQKKWHNRLTRQYTFLCYCDSRLCGFVTLSIDGCIDLLYIDPDMQRRGVGTELLEYVENFARKHSISPLSINASLQSKNLCDKKGFESIDAFVRVKKNQQLSGFYMQKHIQ